MNNLKELLNDLSKVEGIGAAVVVSRDGFVIEGATRNGHLDAEAVGAVVSAGIGSSEMMGRELNVGEMSQMMVEYGKGIIVVSFLGDNAALATVAESTANLGNVRYQVKKRASLIEQAL